MTSFEISSDETVLVHSSSSKAEEFAFCGAGAPAVTDSMLCFVAQTRVNVLSVEDPLGTVTVTRTPRRGHHHFESDFNLSEGVD